MDITTEKYDRQVRLWGQHGQNKCSDARVCLINANSLGSEILKGLCLAGVAGFTILDSHKLTAEDIGSMFVPRKSIGKNRGEVVRDVVLRMNSEVVGQVLPIEKYLPLIKEGKSNSESVKLDENLKCEDLNFWKQFSIVIVTGCLHIDQLVYISKICWSIGIPLIVSKSIGYYGMMRAQTEEHVIVETHDDNPLPDFRLDKPFKDLKDYLDSIDIDDTNDIDKINTYPYIIIIYQYLKKWQKHNGFDSSRVPKNHSEKNNLREFINKGLKHINTLKNNSNGSENLSSSEMMFENFQEATKAVNSCFSVTNELPQNVKDLFENPKLTNPFDTNRPTFWVILSAIKEFYNKQTVGNALPVSGHIPDMLASSEEYIKIQKVYSKKACEDVEEVFDIVQNNIRPGNHSNGQSLLEETKLLCKNIRNLKIMTTGLVHEEYDFKSMNLKDEHEDDEYVAIGLSLKALDIFFSTYGRLPGLLPDQVETDISKLKDCIKQMTGNSTNKLKNLDQFLYEICRVGGAELHATSAFLAGCVTQEIIKYITNQYVTIDETFVYNALTASTQCLKFGDAFMAN